MRKLMDRDVPGRMGRPGVMPGAVGLGSGSGGAVGPGKSTRVEAAGMGVGGAATPASASPTAPLSSAIRSRLETAHRTDLSAVRVGEDPSVAAMGARAHARGLYLLFAPGAYRPGTPAGDELIAHEVAHLLQQAERPVPTSGHVGGTPVNVDRGLERDADALAAAALRGDRLPAAAAPRPSSGPVQGMFEDLEHLLDPVLDAAADLWDSIVSGGSSGGGGGGHAMHVGDVGVVDDPDARLRDPGAGWAPTGATIPLGTRVAVVEVDGKYVRVEGDDGTAWGWTKSSNLDIGGGGKSKGKTDPATPTTPDGPRPAPELPTSDDEWQDAMAEARAGVTVTESFSVTSRALNPDLLLAIRYSHMDDLSQFYDVLTKKSEKTRGKQDSDLTPGRLAYRLADALIERAEAAAAVPGLLAAKTALIDKAAPDGAIDISKMAGGTLRTRLGSGLSAESRASIDGWIKSRYQGGRLIASASEVTELRALVRSAVTALGADPARDARIEQLRADIATCETRVRGVLRARATDTANAKKRALWDQLAGIAESSGVFVDRMLTRYAIEAEDGTVSTLDPVKAISVNFLNPGGFKAGGGRYDEVAIDGALAEVYGSDPAQAGRASAARKFIHTLNTNEGGPASMNTWDGEIVSAGPGLSGGGRLQKSMFEYKTDDPAGFHDALGKFGVDILRAGKDKSPYFTVRVPIDVAAIPPGMRDKVTPGKTIVGSSTTGFPKSGDVYKECAALRYISKDPVLLSRFMYAGEHSYQHFLIKNALASMQKAEGFSFLVGAGDDAQRIGWTRLISPLGADWLAATQAVIAYRYHASASTYEALKVKAAGFYRDTFGADRDPDDLSTSDRKAIGRFVAWQLKPGKYAAYRKQFPSVADDVFPPAKGGGAAAPDGDVEPGDGHDVATDDDPA